MLFLFVFYIPNIGFVWVNYLLVASTVLAIPAILLTQKMLVVDSIVERLIALTGACQLAHYAGLVGLFNPTTVGF